jgi:hypothetical protein
MMSTVRRRVVLARVVASIGVALMVGACGPTPPTASPASSPSLSPSVSAPPTATPAPPSASAPVEASPSEPVESGPPLPPGVSVDPGLLEVLPTAIDGVTLQPDPVTADEVSRDPLLAESALSIAVALAAAPGASDADDLAVANVIRLRPDVFDLAFYQEWRDTYNEAACGVADGVETETETVIDGRQTFVGTCVGGAQTYHTYLIDQGFLVSVTATGERRFGELIIAGLAG